LDLPPSVETEMSQIANRDGEIVAPVDASLFSSLYFYVLDVLEGYYKDFQGSRKYEALKNEVSK
jgi:hypothetical protein